MAIGQPENKMTALSVNAYAKRRGVSHVAVIKAIAAGRLVKCLVYDDKGKPKISDPALADQEWAANTDHTKPKNSVTGNPKMTKGAPPPPGKDAAHEPGTKGPSLAQSQAVRMAYMARLAKLEYDQKAGKLINADEARVAVFNVGRRARDMLMAVPDRVAPLVVGLTDAHEIHRLLTDEMRRVILELGKMKLPEASGE